MKRRDFWDSISDDLVKPLVPDSMYSLPPTDFQNHCYDACTNFVQMAIDFAGRTGTGNVRPPYRTKEITAWIKEARILEAAKREAYAHLKSPGPYLLGTKRALVFMGCEEWVTDGIPSMEQWLETVKARLKEVLGDIETTTKKMERENIAAAIEKAQEGLAKERFTVQRALHKHGVSGKLDAVVQSVPFGIQYGLTVQQLTDHWERAGCNPDSAVILSKGSGSLLKAATVEDVAYILKHGGQIPNRQHQVSTVDVATPRVGRRLPSTNNWLKDALFVVFCHQ